jgi:hypothetical protein
MGNCIKLPRPELDRDGGKFIETAEKYFNRRQAKGQTFQKALKIAMKLPTK